MHPSLSAGGGGGGVDGWVELSTKYSERRSLTGSQDLRGRLLGKIGVTFSGEGCSFYIKKIEIKNKE